MHINDSDQLNAEELTVSAGMSVSSFHTTTNVSFDLNVQYKKVRLDKARDQIYFDEKRVNETANYV